MSLKRKRCADEIEDVVKRPVHSDMRAMWLDDLKTTIKKQVVKELGDEVRNLVISCIQEMVPGMVPAIVDDCLERSRQMIYSQYIG
jgi:hypothetical protein